MRPLPIVLIAVIGSACASTPGARPHEMSATQHEEAAAVAERQAELHQQAYNPRAHSEQLRCLTPGIGPSQALGACWTDVTNPTQEHARRAAELRKAAADHRAASQALREAEADACAGLSEDDRDISPFAHRQDIVRVEPLMQYVYRYPPRLIGATITFRAVPGMSVEWLRHDVDCHLARNAALGHVVPEMSDCPLVPKDVSARVRRTDLGIAVEVRSDNPESAREVLRRAEALVGPAPAP